MAKKISGNLAMIKPEEEWRAEDDMRTLMNAREIKNDPKRMAKVKAMAQKKLTDMACLAGADDGADD